MDSSNAPPAPSIFLPGTLTVATLPTPNAANLGMYARVSDLFGEKFDVVLCSLVGSTYFWQPVRPVYAKSMSGDQNLTLTALSTPSILILNGTLAASRTYTLSPTNAFPGAMFQLVFTGVLGINALTIAGLDAGATLSLLLNSTKTVVFDATSNTWKVIP